jgi:hypothetical protein
LRGVLKAAPSNVLCGFPQNARKTHNHVEYFDLGLQMHSRGFVRHSRHRTRSVGDRESEAGEVAARLGMQTRKAATESHTTTGEMASAKAAAHMSAAEPAAHMTAA